MVTDNWSQFRSNFFGIGGGISFFVIASCLLFSSESAFSLSTEELEVKIREALVSGTASTYDANILDLNVDGQVDVADLVDLLREDSSTSSYPTHLSGYIWAISADFNLEHDNSIPRSYSFALKVEDSLVESTAISGFDPTKGILRQNVATTGQLPGENLPKYSLSSVIPLGTRFSIIEDETNITLESDEVIVPKGDDENPLGVELRRIWSIEISKQNLFATDPTQTNALLHGTVIEQTFGVLPGNQPLVSTGNIFLAPFTMTDIDPIGTY